MRVGQLQPSRPVYYDRNPISQTINYDASAVAPHADTVRGTYTVPSGKKAYLETVWLHTLVATVAAPAGLKRTRILLVIATGGTSTLDDAVLAAVENTAGNKEHVSYQGSLLMMVSDVLELHTEDGGTGGTVDHRMAAKFVEFDA